MRSSAKSYIVLLPLVPMLVGCAMDTVFLGASGVVTDAETHAPIEKAQVSAGRALATTLTKRDGAFSIDPVRRLRFSLFGDSWPSWELVVSKEGYDTTNVYIKTLPRLNEDVEVHLRPLHSGALTNALHSTRR